jgi:Nuclease-related domain
MSQFRLTPAQSRITQIYCRATQLEVTVFIAILVALIIGFVLGRYKTYAFQNRSEARLSRALKMQFVAPDYHLLNHVTLRVEDGTTQIDHVLVSRFGIFVIETKDYKGWIFAGPHDRYWTQVLYRAKFRFQNPLRQNHRHVRAIQQLLDFLPPDVVRPVVVFTGDAEFKTNVPDGVFTVAGFMAFAESTRAEVMSVNRVQFSWGASRPPVFQSPRQPTLSMWRDCDADMVTISRAGRAVPPFLLAAGRTLHDKVSAVEFCTGKQGVGEPESISL